jgi:hypothetical protein
MPVEVGKDPLAVDALIELEKEMRYSLADLPAQLPH